MHGPVPAFFDDGALAAGAHQFHGERGARQIGSGLRAVETLFHEGGHAAHFSNVHRRGALFQSGVCADQRGVCGDAVDVHGLADSATPTGASATPPIAQGQPMPLELIEQAVRETQALRSWDVRSMLTVPFAERMIYELDDRQRTPEHVLARAPPHRSHRCRDSTPAPRPVLSIPHLLSGESSAYYHGYILAEMAVYQTREYFLARDGLLTDNPRIGPRSRHALLGAGQRRPLRSTPCSR